MTPQPEATTRRIWIGVLTGIVTALVIASATGALSAAQSLFDGNPGPTEPGWSPPRDTYSCRKPAPCVGFGSIVVLNALTNNPNYGDERSFLIVKPATDKTAGGWQNVLDVSPGDEVLLRQYVSNGAHSTVAENARAALSVPPESGRHLLVTARNSAANASPRVVTDQVRLDSDRPMSLEYVAHSARIYGNALSPSKGVELSDFYVGDGALLGYDKLDGRLRPAFEGNVIVTARLRVLPG